MTGRLLHCRFRGLLSVHLRYGLHARRVAIATLYIEGFSSFVASTAASIATGWSEPVPGRDLHPLKTRHLFTAHVDIRQVKWQDRAHFLAICARLMRRILIDFARARGYQKRGGVAPHVNFDEAVLVVAQPDVNLVALDDALNRLALVDKRKSKVVELRFFGGMGVKETAEVMKVSADTVMRDWKLAKVWLLRELSGGSGDGT